ncbi:hypothetical protein CHLNCDRAFT_144492 [Chlorella variabilis]|uniref:PITH domain-containing protein n=1 Tax=Chlorella variabilis TaxID=554065 RepID=E1ZBJ2_CHLVA|nr:hypothetical protein CHLNCDRAFT_144492 [Chlorella variabilis]EFN56865.1 hypothetical protein CHLNCDRAFT_144492 [Chlorella variabilis]|eukprot:XP_005848967.1 hypothetical protein CHLNCDRAFT_144492 [Chlorella variabilis]
MGDLNPTIDWSAVECLNQKPGHGIDFALKQGLREDDGLYLESDTDEQLLIHIPFNTACKLSGFAPKRVKLFVNRPTIGFSEAADSAGVQEFDLTEADLEGQQLPLKWVNVLTVFIESNQGDEETTIVQKVAVFGSGGDTFNVAEIKDVSKARSGAGAWR